MNTDYQIRNKAHVQEFVTWAGFSASVFTVFYLRHLNYKPSNWIGLYLVVLVFSVIILLKYIGVSSHIRAHLLMFSLTILVSAFLATGYLDNLALYYLYFVPVTSFLILDSNNSTFWLIIYLLSIFIIDALSYFGIWGYSYSMISVFHGMTSIILVSILAFWNNRLQDQANAVITQKYEANTSYEMAVHQAMNHIIITDQNGKILFANQAASEITGYSNSEMLGNTPRLWGGLQDPDFYQQFWHTIKVEKKPFRGELTNRRKNGDLYHALTRVSPIIDQNKKLLGFIGTEEDITDRITFEEQLKTSNTALAKEKGRSEKLMIRDEAMIQSIGDGILALDTHGKIILFNHQIEQIFGYTKKELEGSMFSDIITARDENGNLKPDIDRAFTIASNSTHPVTMKYVLIGKDGQSLDAKIVATPIKINQKLSGVIEVISDITQEQQIDRVKTEFVSLASHQLRTPLSAISWYSEMLLAGDAGTLSDQQTDFINEIYRGNQRMIDLVNSLLNVSRLELGTFAVELSEVDVDALLHEELKDLQPKIAERHQKLTISAAPDLPHIETDKSLLGMVIQNLLSNAVKYTPDKGQIHVVLRSVKKGEIISEKKITKDSILYTVQDNGFGIPLNQKDKIFEKLFRADNVVEKDVEGTGLGLYIVQEIMKLASGEIWFDSEENKGSTFYVVIPCKGMKPKAGTKKYLNR